MRRSNARAIGNLFSAEAGKFVAVSAGDALETILAAHGSGAAALSRKISGQVMNIDIGGGTTKIAVCQAGEIVAQTAVEAGARLVVTGDDRRIVRLEAFGRQDIADLGGAAEPGAHLDPAMQRALSARMADRIVRAARGGDLGRYLRQPPLPADMDPVAVVFSGGVSEYISGNTADQFNDLGPDLAREVHQRVKDWGVRIENAQQRIRATVVGASQYAVQVSGSTIFLDPGDAVPVRNVAAIAPKIDLTADAIDSGNVAAAIRVALSRLELDNGDRPVALAIPWSGSATYARLGALCRGVIEGLAPILAKGHPLIFVADGDIGGLIGVHFRAEEGLTNPIISIDSIELKEFDFIDIGAIVSDTGAVPVVIKSLLFPAE